MSFPSPNARSPSCVSICRADKHDLLSKSKHKAEYKAHLDSVASRIKMHRAIIPESPPFGSQHHISLRCLAGGNLCHRPYACIRSSTPLFDGNSNVAAYVASLRAHHKGSEPMRMRSRRRFVVVGPFTCRGRSSVDESGRQNSLLGSMQRPAR